VRGLVSKDLFCCGQTLIISNVYDHKTEIESILYLCPVCKEGIEIKNTHKTPTE